MSSYTTKIGRLSMLNGEISKHLYEHAQKAKPMLPEDYNAAVDTVLAARSTDDLRKEAVKQGLTQSFIK